MSIQFQFQFQKKYNIMKLLTKFTKPILLPHGHKIYS
jgi:hypothetical protein